MKSYEIITVIMSVIFQFTETLAINLSQIIMIRMVTNHPIDKYVVEITLHEIKELICVEFETHHAASKRLSEICSASEFYATQTSKHN
jgi:hypothetical protein